jgi:hypothetical protein
MSVTKIRTFGGILPSQEPRVLPDDAAQAAVNLDMRTVAFTPALGPGSSVTTVANNTLSVYRTPAGDWLSSTTDTNYVLGQLQDTTDLRVYLTGRSAFPEVWQGGSYRRLGVPAPTVAPTLTLNVVDEYSSVEADQGRARVIKEYRAAIDTALTVTRAGYANNAPVSLPRGAYWLPHGTVANMPTNSAEMGAYCLPIVVSGSSYKMVYDEDNFALDASFGGKRIVYLGQNYLAIPFYAQAPILSFSTSTFTTAAQAIKRPDDDTTQLLTNADITAASTEYAAKFATTAEPQRTMIADLDQQIQVVASIIAPVAADILTEQTRQFYSKTDVAAEITTAIANFAEAAFLAAKAAFEAPAGVNDTYLGGGGSETP